MPVSSSTSDHYIRTSSPPRWPVKSLVLKTRRMVGERLSSAAHSARISAAFNTRSRVRSGLGFLTRAAGWTRSTHAPPRNSACLVRAPVLDSP